MAWTYSGDPSSADKDAVRFEIQDTNSTSPLLQDAEIQWAIKTETGQTAGAPTTLSTGDIFRASARCMESLARSFAAQADTEIGSLKIAYSDQSKNYADRASELRAKAQGMNAPYAGGLSQSEKRAWEENTDLTQPAFTREEFDSPWTGSQAGFGTEDFGPPAA